MSDPEIQVYSVKDQFDVNWDKNLPKPPFRMMIVGPSGSGKTQLIMNMLMNQDFYWMKDEPFFSKIYIMSPTVLADPIWKALKKNKQIFERVTITDQFETSTLDEMLNSDDRSPKLLIIDDFAAHLKMTDKTILNCFFRSRHVNCSVILVSQNYKSIPKPCRLNASDIFLFNFTSQKELKLIEEELATKDIQGDDFVQFLKDMLQEPYSFIWKDRQGNFHKKFKKIQFTSE